MLRSKTRDEFMSREVELSKLMWRMVVVRVSEM